VVAGTSRPDDPPGRALPGTVLGTRYLGGTSTLEDLLGPYIPTTGESSGMGLPRRLGLVHHGHGTSMIPSVL